MDIAKLMTEINERLARVESLLERGEVTPEELLQSMTSLSEMTNVLKDATPDALEPHEQALLNLGAQLASLQAKMGRARDGLGAAIVDIDKRRKALHNYSTPVNKKK